MLHENVILVSMIVSDDPRVQDERRLKLTPIGEGIQRLEVHIGFMEKPDVPNAIRLAMDQGLLPNVNPGDITYFVGR